VSNTDRQCNPSFFGEHDGFVPVTLAVEKERNRSCLCECAVQLLLAAKVLLLAMVVRVLLMAVGGQAWAAMAAEGSRTTRCVQARREQTVRTLQMATASRH
jgi:hypothetical protein